MIGAKRHEKRRVLTVRPFLDDERHWLTDSDLQVRDDEWSPTREGGQSRRVGVHRVFSRFDVGVLDHSRVVGDERLADAATVFFVTRSSLGSCSMLRDERVAPPLAEAVEDDLADVFSESAEPFQPAR